MRISRLYLDTPIVIDQTLLLPDRAKHYLINVLRLKSGDPVHLFNGLEDCDYDARLDVQGKQVHANIIAKLTHPEPKGIESWLLQAIGKVEHMDFIVQKTTELGVSRIVLFNSERTQSPLKGTRLDKKLQHWKNIAISACEQCGRHRLPSIEFVGDLVSAINHSPQDNRILMDFDGLNLANYQWSEAVPFVLLVGPEGGFTADEIDFAKARQFKPVLLGPRILRMETASMALISILQFQFGDF